MKEDYFFHLLIPVHWIKKGGSKEELLLWLSGLRTQHSVCEDSGLIPGLTQGVKNPALL